MHALNGVKLLAPLPSDALQAPHVRSTQVATSFRVGPGCAARGMSMRLLVSIAIACVILSTRWWDSRGISEKQRGPYYGNLTTSASVCMATALSGSNPIVVGNLEVQRIPCLSVRTAFVDSLLPTGLRLFLQCKLFFHRITMYGCCKRQKLARLQLWIHQSSSQWRLQFTTGEVWYNFRAASPSLQKDCVYQADVHSPVFSMPNHTFYTRHCAGVSSLITS